jgi:hypothetical protein
MALFAEEAEEEAKTRIEAPSGSDSDEGDEECVDLSLYQPEYVNFNHYNKEDRSNYSSWLAECIDDFFNTNPEGPHPSKQEDAWNNLLLAHKRSPFRNLHLLPHIGQLYGESELRGQAFDRVRKRKAHRRKKAQARAAGTTPARARLAAKLARSKLVKKTPALTPQQRKALTEKGAQQACYLLPSSCLCLDIFALFLLLPPTLLTLSLCA